MLYIAPEIPNPMNAGHIPVMFTDVDEEGDRTMNGADISAARNLSIGDADPAQVEAAKQPRYNAAGINNLGCMEAVDSYPTGERLVSDNDVSPRLPEFTLQFCWQPTIAPIGSFFLYQLIWSTASPESHSVFYDFATSEISSAPIVFGFGAGVVTSNYPIVLNGKYIISIIYDQGNSLHSFRINGSDEGTSNDMSPTITNKRNYSILSVSFGLGIPCLFGRHFLYEEALPLHVVKRNERHLANRYNVSI